MYVQSRQINVILYNGLSEKVTSACFIWKNMERHSYTRLTLALDIGEKVLDGPFTGYHELGTIKHQVDLHDTLTIEPFSRLSMECDDPGVPCDERNLCLQAVTLLQKEFGINRSVHVTLKKRIPVEGGLAGGSANAATTIMILNDLWKLRLSLDRLEEIGRMLGMDVPFYFTGMTVFDSEAGGTLKRIATGIDLTFVLALPDFGVSTSEAYRDIDHRYTGGNRMLTDQMQQFCLANDRQGVVSCIHNDFERSVLRRHPRLGEIKEELLRAGCSAASLSGSGSTVFGVAADYKQACNIQDNMSCRTLVARTLKH